MSTPLRRLLIAPLVFLIGTIVLFGNTKAASAKEKYLAVGQFEEHGRGVKGHGLVLRRALRAEFSQSGTFELVADDRAKRAASRRIKRDLSHYTDERQWVEVGRAVGATHLLLGDVQEDRNTCLAFVQLIDLETQKTKVTLPEYYDCTHSDLVQAAGLLSVQLTGRRASQAKPRRHLVRHDKPMKIEMRDRIAIIDGKRYTLYEGELVPGEPEAETEPEPQAETEPSHNWTPAFDLTRWPGLLPPEDGFTVHHLARLGSTYQELVVSGLFVLPLLFCMFGAIVTRFDEDHGHRILRVGFRFSMLAVSAEVAIVAFYQWVIGRSVLLDTTVLLLAAPPLGVVLWVVAVRMLRVSSAIGFFRQIPWTLLFAGFFLALLLVASKIVTPAWVLGLITAVFFVMMRFVAVARQKRRAT